MEELGKSKSGRFPTITVNALKDGVPVKMRVLVYHIVGYHKSTVDETKTALYLTGGEPLAVTETPESLDALILVVSK